MPATPSWHAELQTVVDLMRQLSRQTDPQVAGQLYADGLRKGLVPSDEWLSVSRRDLRPPAYRITRSTKWAEAIDPWRQRDRLPVFASGLLSELIYSNYPAVIDDLPARVAPDDPAAEYFRGMRMLVTLPNYDDGEALNMGVLLIRDPATFPYDRIPVMVWQANLYGRATLNLVLRNQLRDAYEALDRELRTVGEIQRSLLPPTLPDVPGLRLAAHYETSARAGGDYYDFFPMAGPPGRGAADPHPWGVILADVSGHGTPAAVVMAITHAIAHTRPGPAAPPAAVLRYVNEKLAARYTANGGTFVTAFYAVYDPVARTLTHACAGHNPPRLRRRDGSVTSLDCRPGLPLGIDPGEDYEDCTERLAPGDALLLYTDGITEARGPGGDMFGTDRLDAVLAAPGVETDAIVPGVLERLRAFTNGAPAKDDQTLLSLAVV